MLKEKIQKNKFKIIQGVILSSCMFMVMLLPTYAALGDSVQNFSTSVTNEIANLANILGVIGIVITGVFIFIGKRNEALGIGVSVVIGYLILKYATTIWNAFQGMI